MVVVAVAAAVVVAALLPPAAAAAAAAALAAASARSFLDALPRFFRSRAYSHVSPNSSILGQYAFLRSAARSITHLYSARTEPAHRISSAAGCTDRTRD